MIKKYTDLSEITFVLDNLREEDEEELFALHGENWKKITIENLKDKEFQVLYGLCNNEELKPIAIGGFYEQFVNDRTIACVWLLTSFYILKNKTLFFKEFRRQLLQANEKYKIMYNFIYKSNSLAKNWLKKFGFIFDSSNPLNLKYKEGFEFFYKLNLERRN